MGTDAQFPL